MLVYCISKLNVVRVSFYTWLHVDKRLQYTREKEREVKEEESRAITEFQVNNAKMDFKPSVSEYARHVASSRWY